MEEVPATTYQRREPFPDFMEHVDENMMRRAPTPEEKAQMDANIIQLGKLFEGTDAKWHIDGALNISLLKGEYIGIHKDIDVSVEEVDLEKFEKHLATSGYGLFLTYPSNTKQPEGEHMYERVSGKDFLGGRKGGLMICAVDESGDIQEQNVKPLNFIDVHPIRRNESGSPLGWGNTELPNKWFEAKNTTFQGQQINLSHPAKVAYFKLHQGRPYDLEDLRTLTETGKLTSNDVDDIERTIMRESTLMRWANNVRSKRLTGLKKLREWVAATVEK